MDCGGHPDHRMNPGIFKGFLSLHSYLEVLGIGESMHSPSALVKSFGVNCLSILLCHVVSSTSGGVRPCERSFLSAL